MSFTSAIGAVASGQSIQDYDPSEPMSAEDEEFYAKAASFPTYYVNSGAQWDDSGPRATEGASMTVSASDLVGKLVV